MLHLALPWAQKLGLKKVLITCLDTNIGSQTIIERNGGVLENIVKTEKGEIIRRYWIQL